MPEDEKLAFPSYWNHQRSVGMKLRDYFAARAMTFFLQRNFDRGTTINGESVAESSYAMADAMLKVREPNA